MLRFEETFSKDGPIVANTCQILLYYDTSFLVFIISIVKFRGLRFKIPSPLIIASKKNKAQNVHCF